MTSAEDRMTPELRLVPIDQIRPHDGLPSHGGRTKARASGRGVKGKDDSTFQRLIDSIESLGLIQTIAIDEQGQLLAGRRRLEALRDLGVEGVPCMILKGLSMEQAYEVMWHENSRRLNYSDPETALIIERYHRMKQEKQQTIVSSLGKNAKGETTVEVKKYWSQEDTAKKLGIKQKVVSDSIIIADKVKADPERWESQTGRTITRAHGRDVAREEWFKKGYEKVPDYFRTCNTWFHNDRDRRYGVPKWEHGVVPGQVIENLLWVYTRVGDLIVDPMAGGNTTGDVCRVWKRKCLSYDIIPVNDDVIYNDIWNGLPEECRGAKLIYLDPPYGNYKLQIYDEKLEEYWLFQNHIINVAAEYVAVDGFVAYIIMDYKKRDENGRRYGCGMSLIGESYRALQDHPALEFDAGMGIPLPQAAFRMNPHKDTRENHNFIGLRRTLWVFRRVDRIKCPKEGLAK